MALWRDAGLRLRAGSQLALWRERHCGSSPALRLRIPKRLHTAPVGAALVADCRVWPGLGRGTLCA